MTNSRGGREYKAERNAEIRRLRLEEKLSIVEIGRRYGISKQRVQQIVGLTGHMVHPGNTPGWAKRRS